MKSPHLGEFCAQRLLCCCYAAPSLSFYKLKMITLLLLMRRVLLMHSTTSSGPIYILFAFQVEMNEQIREWAEEVPIRRRGEGDNHEVSNHSTIFSLHKVHAFIELLRTDCSSKSCASLHTFVLRGTHEIQWRQYAVVFHLRNHDGIL